MASARSTIQIIIDATTRGLEAAAARARAAVAEIDDAANSASVPGSGLRTLYQVIIAAIPVLGALVGQALAAVPALFQLGAIAGTIALGLDGISKAAQVAAPALDKLKAAVSATFAKELTPAFQQIALILPQLTSGFQLIASSLSRVFGDLVSKVAPGTQGLRDLQTVLKGASDLVLGLGGGLTSFFADLLHASAALTSQMRAFGTAIGGVFAGVGAAFRELADTGTLQRAFAGLTDTISGIGVALKELIKLLIEAGAAVGTDFGDSFRLLGDIFRDLSPAFSDLAKITSGALKGALTFLRDVVRELKDPLKALLDVVVPLAPGLGKLAAALLLIKVGKGVVSGILSLVGALGGLRGLGLIGLAVGLGAIAVEVDKLNGAASGGEPEKLGILPGTLHNIVEAGKQLLSGDISGIIADIRSEVDQTSEAWRTGQAPLAQWVDKVKTSFSNDLIAPMEAFGTKVNEVVDKIVKSFSNDFITPLQTFGDNVNNVITQVITGMTNFGTAVNNAITSVITGMSNFGALVNQKIDEVVGFIAQLPNRTTVALANFGATLLNSAVTGWNNFISATSTQIGVALSIIGQVPGQVGSALLAFGTTLVNVAVTGWNNFISATTAQIGQALGIIGQVPGQIGSALAALGGVLVNVATTAWNNFLGAIRSGTDAVLGFVRGIPGSIAGAIGNLAGVLVGPGRALMDGLLSGIRAGLNAVLAFASTIAAQIAAVKGPIPKDRKTLVPAGVALMDGLLAGMQSGSGGVLAFAASIADQVARSSSAGLIASGISLTRAANSATTAATTAPSSASEQPITVNVMLSQEQITELARVEIARQNRVTKRTVLAGSGVTF